MASFDLSELNLA